ncbi:MAG: Ca-activated chloride channel [Candidatus Hydrogenedentes bacterium]|nr:Ca-activated chloride channel [Candidatus Hydrogenedentota bacterium]
MTRGKTTGQRRGMGHSFGNCSGSVLVMLLTVLFLAGLAALFILPSTQRARESARRSTPANTLKQMDIVRKMADDGAPFTPEELTGLRAEAASTGTLKEFHALEQELAQAGKLQPSGGIEQYMVSDINSGPDLVNDPAKVYWPGHNTEAYDHIDDNRFTRVTDEPLSTFSIDVDTASYSNVRRFIEEYTLPPADAVRIEEMVNYFAYDYAPPEDGTPFAAHVAVAGCPWAEGHRLVRIGLKGWEAAMEDAPPCNLVFLLDVSGSMSPSNKLPAVQRAMRLLVEQLRAEDHVAIVTYAGTSGLTLPSTSGAGKRVILNAIDRLRAGGSTNGGAGVELAYETARGHFIENGVNRVILATDGDFNVGVTDQGSLIRLIEKEAKTGVFLTAIGVGMGNLKDATLEQLADKGNGNYAYFDRDAEAEKVFGSDLTATLVTIAKDVKIQVEFNPENVVAYRLIGYENRMLAKQDFNDDTKDAGEIGAGYAVTALYEILPAGAIVDAPPVDPLRYQRADARSSKKARTGELLYLKIRYKAPDGDESKLLSFPVVDEGLDFAHADPDFKFATAVASFGMLLRGAQDQGRTTFDGVIELAKEGAAYDPAGYRQEFVQMVEMAKAIAKQG